MFGSNGPTTALRQVPVKAWVYRETNGTGGLTLEEAQLFIYRLNQLYEGGQASVHFYLAGGITYLDNSANYYNVNIISETSFNALVNANHLTGALNVHFVRTANANGRGTFPWKTPNFALVMRTQIDGQQFQVNDFTVSVLAHEAGHCLGLLHTHHPGRKKSKSSNGETSGCYQEVVSRVNRNYWYNGCFDTDDRLKCEVNGDFLCDTKADPQLNATDVAHNGCTLNPIGNDSDGDPWDPNPRNIMAYGWSPCRNFLSPHQIGILLNRSSVNPSPLAHVPGPNPVVNNPLSSIHPEVDVYEPDDFPFNVSPTYLNSARDIGQAETQHHAFHTEPNGLGGLATPDVDYLPGQGENYPSDNINIINIRKPMP